MTLRLANAPCSWGVETADDPRNPAWRDVLRDCAAAGYRGIELGPIGFMTEDPLELTDALAEHDLTLTGGVVFQPFHDASQWHQVMESALRSCKSLVAHGAKHLVLVDSTTPARVATAGRPDIAPRLDGADWAGMRNRIMTLAKMGQEVYGLTVSIHPLLCGYVGYLPEIEALLSDVPPEALGLCLDTGVCAMAGIDPAAFARHYIDRISYVHFTDTDQAVRERMRGGELDYDAACVAGIFCNPGTGMVNFRAVRNVLENAGYDGWCVAERGCHPDTATSPQEDAVAIRSYFKSIGIN